MKIHASWLVAAAVVGTVCLVTISVTAQQARPARTAQVPIDSDDIGGVVTSAKGPEAGVWVIAETTSLPTPFR
jgi:hypothetical protein